MNPILLTDAYKVHHHRMYPDGTTKIYSNLTPRRSRIPGINSIVFFGLQHFILEYLIKQFNEEFFGHKEWYNGKEHRQNVHHKEYTMKVYTRHIKVDTEHLEKLYDLGYLPIEIKALPEGTLCPIGVPCLTITNTHPDFGWLTNYLETLMSCMLWQPITSATIAYEYKKILTAAAEQTDRDNVQFVQWQGHDFSMRGMSSVESAILSGMGHLTSFTGTDTIPAIYQLEESYAATGLIGASVPATEHSVMCMGSKEDEIGTFKALLDKYPNGVLSVVSDTWDLWKVCTEYLPALKEQILARDGKLVIRPDSGDPVDILCGKKSSIIQFINEYPDNEELEWESLSHYVYENYQDDVEGNIVEINKVIYTLGNFKYMIEEYGWENGLSDIIDNVKSLIANGMLEKIDKPSINHNESSGVIELLWDTFGGTVNNQGYKVLDSHIGAIYGDAITMDRAKQICERLKAKGFASTNVVLGIGSYTYQYNTRDTFGFAIKATYGEVEVLDGEGSCEGTRIEPREIFKDPVTDDGTKKSKKGLLCVIEKETAQFKSNAELSRTKELIVLDQCTPKMEQSGLLQTVFKNGELVRKTTLEEIRERLKL